MKLTKEIYPGKFVIRCVIEKSAKDSVPFRRQKTWHVDCLRPDLSLAELRVHINRQIRSWVDRIKIQAEEKTKKPARIEYAEI